MAVLTERQLADVEDFMNTDDGIRDVIRERLEMAIEALDLPRDLDNELKIDYIIEVKES